MAAAHKKNKRASTPGRPKKKENEYFDLGKVGRKTGITLEDKGIRDEHGLEPMEHIFSSPMKNGDERTSSDPLMQESSGPSLDRTLASRKTPRLPPPRASTPKHTNIGSPKRMSTGQRITQRLSTGLERDASPIQSRTQPPANRVLDFGNEKVHKSIEISPFKPRHVLRRSFAQAQKDPFASPSKPSSDAVVEFEPIGKIDNEDEVPLIEDGPLMTGDDDYYDAIPHQASADFEEPNTGAGAAEELRSPVTSRPVTRRTSKDAAESSQLIQLSSSGPKRSSAKKRDHSVLEDDQGDVTHQSLLDSQLSTASGPAHKKQRGKKGRGKEQEVVVHHRDGEDETIDPALLACGDQYEADSALEAALEPEPVAEKGKGKGKGKGKKGKGKGKVKILSEKDPNLPIRPSGSPVKIKDSPSKLRNDRSGSRQGSMGPMNNYHLRATTPFEDAGERVSRFGRNLIQPLKYWANEARIYKRGVIEGIVRAEEVEIPKKKRPKKKGRKRINKLDDIDEDSETESVMADEWEDEVGVIAGMVANWDPETQMGNPEDLIREDLGFASSSIVTRPVTGSNTDFSYAKILTLPFFGSGVVELPPNGFKRAKNSRKMQQCFFVHEGKVMVEVGAASVGETTQFAISKGGVWVVPRGNDYAITNESKTKTARIFFAQGCEVENGGRQQQDVTE